MKEYFDNDGHLTDFALEELVGGSPDEMARLEIAEHLSFCDQCTERYTSLLCGDVLIAPLQPVKEPLMRELRKRARVLFFNRYVTVSVAACLALTLWFTGAFTPNITIKGRQEDGPLASVTNAFTKKTAELGNSFTIGVNEFFDSLGSFDLKGVFNREKE